MGYKGFMGYVGDFPASQLGRWDFLWVMGGYGLREVWVIRVSTVVIVTRREAGKRFEHRERGYPFSNLIQECRRLR